MMAHALAANGASKVYILGRRPDPLSECIATCPPPSASDIIVPITCDITSKPSLAAAASHVSSHSGFVNLVIANSGTSGPSMSSLPANPSIADIQALLMSQEPADYTATFATNVTGVLYTAAAFLELLDAGNKKGNMPATVRSQVIATGSVGAWNKGLGVGFAYNTSKAAVHHLVKMLHQFLGPHRIRVNAMAPGCECQFRSSLHTSPFPLSRDLD
jgi:NAD(P)-dependent dehydrogenase (short-subunit alcohol dehydrogenase family)